MFTFFFFFFFCSPYLSLLTSASNVSIVKKKKEKKTCYLQAYKHVSSCLFNLNLVRSHQSATSIWNKKSERWRLWSESSEKRWRTQWQHSFVCFSQSLTSKRDITLFLNKHFFCDKRLWLWFNICFTSQQYRFSIYSRHRGVQLSPTEREWACVCLCVYICPSCGFHEVIQIQRYICPTVLSTDLPVEHMNYLSGEILSTQRKI